MVTNNSRNEFFRPVKILVRMVNVWFPCLLVMVKEQKRESVHISSAQGWVQGSPVFAIGQYVHHLCMSPIVCFTIAMFSILKTSVKVSLVIHRLTLLSFHS